jgi:hypothetical protein
MSGSLSNKGRTRREAGHVELHRMIQPENLKERGKLLELGSQGRVILKSILQACIWTGIKSLMLKLNDGLF